MSQTSIIFAAGKQAEVLNVVLSDLLHGHPASANKLKEVLGHTPLQVGFPLQPHAPIPHPSLS